VAEDVDIEFGGDVSNQFHEHVLVRHLHQFHFRLALPAAVLCRRAANELPTPASYTEWLKKVSLIIKKMC